MKFGDPFEHTIVNVYEKSSKKIVFTGSISKAALFIGTTASNVVHSIRLKTCIKKKYVVRRKGVEQNG